MGLLVWAVKHGSCSAAWEVRDCVPLEANWFLVSPLANILLQHLFTPVTGKTELSG